MRVFSGRLSCFFVVALLLGGLSGCSTEQFVDPIKTFSDAAATATSSMKDVNTALATSTFDYAIASAVKTDPAKPSLGSLVVKNCGVFQPGQAVDCGANFAITGMGQSATLDRQDYTDPLGNMIAVMEAIQDYAGNLAAIEADTTASDVNASVDSIQASLVQLMKATSPNDPNPVPPDLPAAAGEGVKWVFGQYIETVKFDALQKATAAAQPPLEKAAAVFRKMEESIKIKLSAAQVAVVEDAQMNMNVRDESSIRSTVATMNAYDDMLKAPLSPMLDNLVAAHGKLLEALNGGGKPSLRDALAKLKALGQQAGQVVKIAEDIKAAAKPKP